ncbi:MAG: hypothetical protein WDN03_15580 [Rhizomicrobium sp.]
MKTILAAVAVAAALCLGAGFAAEVPLKGYVSDKSKDYFGYFLPTAPIKVGKFQLRNLFLGAKGDFVQYEGGKSDKAFAAVMIEFDDVTSPKKTGEDGQEFYTNTVRILPGAYAIGNGKVRFAGTDKALGAVTFEGALSADFFKKPAADVPHPDDHPVLKGKLTVGGKSFDAAFNWFGGD